MSALKTENVSSTAYAECLRINAQKICEPLKCKKLHKWLIISLLKLAPFFFFLISITNTITNLLGYQINLRSPLVFLLLAVLLKLVTKFSHSSYFNAITVFYVSVSSLCPKVGPCHPLPTGCSLTWHIKSFPAVLPITSYHDCTLNIHPVFHENKSVLPLLGKFFHLTFTTQGIPLFYVSLSGRQIYYPITKTTFSARLSPSLQGYTSFLLTCS